MGKWLWFSRRSRQLLLLTVLTMGSGLLLSLAANAIYDAIKDHPQFVDNPWLPLAMVACGVLIAWGLAIPTALRVFGGSHGRHWRIDQAVNAPHRALVLMPSLLKSQAMEEQGRSAIALAASHPAGRPQALDEITKPSGDQFSRWSWQQTLRVLRALRKLRVVVAVPSKQFASANQFEAFKAVLQAFRPGLEVLSVEPAVDALDYNDIERGLSAAVELCQERGIKPRHTCFDITSGLKSFAAVAAIKTLNSRYVFSYVVTDSDCDDPSYHGQVLLYEVSLWSDINER